MCFLVSVHVLSYFVDGLICLQICDCGYPSCEHGFPIVNFLTLHLLCVLEGGLGRHTGVGHGFDVYVESVSMNVQDYGYT